MPLTEKQIKRVQDVLKKVGDFQRQPGYSSKLWLESMEAQTAFLDCENLRKACVFEAQDSAGRTWWNSIPDVDEMNYEDLREVFLERWCPDHILQPTLQAYIDQRKQRPREHVKEFSEAFLVLLDQLNPRPSEIQAISMFKDKLLPKISAALVGDRFDSLQEAINKAQVVKEKRIRHDANPSFVFLQGIEPSNKHTAFESTTSEIFKVPTIATVTQAPTKRKLEETLEELTSTLKSNTESFNALSKQFANKFNEEGVNFPVINIIDQNPSRQVQFSQPFQPSNPNQFNYPAKFFPSFVPAKSNQKFPFPGRGNLRNTNSQAKTFPRIQDETQLPKHLKFCNYCNKWFHTKQECFKLHPELLEQHRNKRAKRTQEQQVPQQYTLSTLDGESTKFTAMLIIGATTLDGEDLHICQDSGASLNAIKMSTAIKANCDLIPLFQPIVALMGNSSKLIANFKINFTFKYGKSLFTAEYFVFEKLRFQIIIGNQFLFERLAIVIYEEPSTYLLDDEGEKVQFFMFNWRT